MSELQIILFLSLLGGALALDATAALQLMLSQPLVAAGIAGVVVGDPELGLVVGATLQLVWIGVLPVGAAPFPDGAVAGVVGVGTAAILAGSGVAGGLAFAGGVVIAICVGAAGKKVTSLVRRANERHAKLASAKAEDGDPSGVTAAVGLGLATRFVSGCALSALAMTASLLLKPLASLAASGSYPTMLWAAPIAAAAILAGGKARSESIYIVAGFAAGLAIVVLA